MSLLWVLTPDGGGREVRVDDPPSDDPQRRQLDELIDGMEGRFIDRRVRAGAWTTASGPPTPEQMALAEEWIAAYHAKRKARG